LFYWWHGHLGRVFTGWKPVPRKETADSVVWLNTYCAEMTSKSGNTTKKPVVSETSTGIVIKENTEKTRDSI